MVYQVNFLHLVRPHGFSLTLRWRSWVTGCRPWHICFFLKLSLFSLYGYFVCLYICVTFFLQCPQRPEKRASDSVRLVLQIVVSQGWESNSGPLEMLPILWTTEPPLLSSLRIYAQASFSVYSVSGLWMQEEQPESSAPVPSPLWPLYHFKM